MYRIGGSLYKPFEFPVSSLPTYNKIISSESLRLVEEETYILIDDGCAIANLRVNGTGWKSATLCKGSSVISTAFERISNTFDLFSDPSICLPVTGYIRIHVAPLVDIEYDIVSFVTSLAGYIRYPVEQISLVHNILNIDIEPPCSMLELRSTRELNDPCLKFISSGIDKVVIVPFVKHRGIWKLEFTNPIYLRGGVMLMYVSEKNCNIMLYAHCLNILAINYEYSMVYTKYFVDRLAQNTNT
jgi:hypothetical protein